MHCPPLQAPALRVPGMLVILACILVADAFTRPEYELGAFAIFMNAVVLDRLACGHMNPDWDDNALLAAAVLARLLGLLRAGAPPSGAPVPDALLGVVWCLLGLFCTWHAHDARPDGRWLPWFLSLACLLMVCDTHAGFECWYLYAARVVAFAGLSMALHAAPLPAASFAHRRGFLVCFGPLLLVEWTTAWVFAVAAVSILLWQTAREPPGGGYEPADTAEFI